MTGGPGSGRPRHPTLEPAGWPCLHAAQAQRAAPGRWGWPLILGGKHPVFRPARAGRSGLYQVTAGSPPLLVSPEKVRGVPSQKSQRTGRRGNRRAYLARASECERRRQQEPASPRAQTRSDPGCLHTQRPVTLSSQKAPLTRAKNSAHKSNESQQQPATLAAIETAQLGRCVGKKGSALLRARSPGTQATPGAGLGAGH